MLGICGGGGSLCPGGPPSHFHPRPLELSDLSRANWSANIEETVELAGGDFFTGMYLDVEDAMIPMAIVNSWPRCSTSIHGHGAGETRRIVQIGDALVVGDL